MKNIKDGPASPLFQTITIDSNSRIEDLDDSHLSDEFSEARELAPGGSCVCWGIPFEIDGVTAIVDQPVSLSLASPTTAPWFVLLHTSDLRKEESNQDGFMPPKPGTGRMSVHAADYVFVYEDRKEEKVAIRRRYEIGPIQRVWGENCSSCVAHRKPYPFDDQAPGMRWGYGQTKAENPDGGLFVAWVWAFQNPRKDVPLVEVRLEPVSGVVVVFGLTAGFTDQTPLRWKRRQKAVIHLPEGTEFDPTLDEKGLLREIQLDLGAVISATPRKVYPNQDWEDSRHNLVPDVAENELLVEFSAHPEAQFQLALGRNIPVANLESANADDGKEGLRIVPPAHQRVLLRTIDHQTKKPVPVKLHIHGREGEYLPPVDHHRMPNSRWFEDYAPEFWHGKGSETHICAYVPGETLVDLPIGDVYVEATKGFEIRPIRKVVAIGPETTEVTIELEKVLPWREKGWITADTHVHFLSPATAMLEGAAEGVNLINLLASQWGELMTNVGDFDGQTTFGSKEAGGEGEYLVRVGTENRQHVLGHISLLGYAGNIIAPMCSGGPQESAIGDPVEILLTEWARQCRNQGGLVIMPHFPQPRMEIAASLVLEEIDGIEMCSWGNHYSGINPYSLTSWYQYLNNGYLVPAVGGTDKMSVSTAVGTIRTYARIPEGQAFSNDSWMEAVRRRETFCTYGPLLEFAVEGQAMGSIIPMTSTGGTVDITWKVASVTIPMTRVDLIVNGEVRESQLVDAAEDSGTWTLRVERSSWLALLVQGQYADKDEMIAAHSTPVMVNVEDSPLFSAADAAVILEQIEGTLTFLDDVGTRAETRRYREMRTVIESAYRRLHNRMHAMGYDHHHGHGRSHSGHRD